MKMRKIQIGLQLYTLREAMEKDFVGTLREVAKMGYEGVEFYNYGGLPAEEMKALLKELGLKAVGSHIQLIDLKNNIENEINYLKVIGSNYAICPWLPEDVRDAESWISHIEALAIAGQACHDAGIQLLYHNHEFEFETLIEGQPVLEVLFDRLPAHIIKPELDLGWVQYSGIDPIAYIKKYADKLPVVHIKDYLKASRTADLTIDTVELGQGDLPLLNIITALTETDVEWIVVEQDTCSNPPLQSVAESLNWLNKHYLYQFN